MDGRMSVVRRARSVTEVSVVQGSRQKNSQLTLQGRYQSNVARGQSRRSQQRSGPGR
ncbi:unnamed protein product [Staurois parvus]|uniref:Uncharacterized protein n=1 Tax=Staurois parvus TaxID=386267 RepID=A0ABN9BJQ9_9NEOB|nr:unnamed protein product [Staurois parvus]